MTVTRDTVGIGPPCSAPLVRLPTDGEDGYRPAALIEQTQSRARPCTTVAILSPTETWTRIPARLTDESADWVQIIWRGPWVWMALVVVFFCVPLFIGSNRTDVENDEAGYSFSVEKMLETGDWLTPRRHIRRPTALLRKTAAEVLDRRVADSAGPASREPGSVCGSGMC